MKKIMEFRKFIIFIAMLLIIGGSYAYYDIPKQETPDLSIPITIMTIEAIGENAEYIDQNIVLPLKDDLLAIKDVDYIDSIAYDNYAFITIWFEFDISDYEKAYDDVFKVVNTTSVLKDYQVNLQDNIKHADILYLFQVEDLSIAEEFVTELKRVSSISNVKISDYELDYYEVVLDLNVLEQLNLTPKNIADIIESQGKDYQLGFVGERTLITDNAFIDVKELSNMLIAPNLKLDDVAEIKLNTQKPYYNEYADEEVLFISANFREKTDITKYSEEIRELNKKYPEITEYVFAGDYVDDALSSITKTLLISIFLVLVVVTIGLGFRSFLAIIITFPLTFFATIGILYLFGYELQKISIAGLIISIGIIVDNSIVVIDAISYHLTNKKSMDDSIKLMLKENSVPILTSTATTIMAFSPILFLPGIGGQMAFTLPLTVIIALIISYLSAIFVIPIFARKLLKPKRVKEAIFLKKILEKSLKISHAIVIFTFLIFIGSLYSVYNLQTIKIFPSAEKDFVFVRFTNLASSNLEDLETIAEEISSYIDSEELLTSLAYQMPHFYSTMSPVSRNNNTGVIIYKSTRALIEKEINDLEEDLRYNLDETVVVQVSQLEMNNPGPSILVNVYDVMPTDVEKLKNEVSAISGVKYSDYFATTKTDYYVFDFKEEFLLQNMIYKAEAELAIASYINDMPLDVMRVAGVDENVIVSTNIVNVEELLATSIKIGEQFYLLEDIGSFSKTEMDLAIRRYNFNLYDSIEVYIEDDANVFKVSNEIEKLVESKSWQYDIRGEKEMTETLFKDVFVAGVFAFLSITIILYIQFRSLKNVLIILTSIPMAFIGSAIFMIIFNQDITFSATLGLVSLIGIVVNNGILLLDYIDKALHDEVIKRCVNAVSRRSRAILISNVTTIIGLVPLIIFGDDFFRPMAITLVGGLTLAIPLTIFVIPSIYYLFYKNVNKSR